MAKIKKPNAEQRAALRDYAARNGRDWKRKLSDDWSRAGSARFDRDRWSLLQQVRNQFGPSWLYKVKLGDLNGSGSLRGLGNADRSEAVNWLKSANDNFNRIKKSRMNVKHNCHFIEHYTDVIAEATAAMAVAGEGSSVIIKAQNLAREATDAQRLAVQLCRRTGK